jgi:ABC-type antimicrobial peptide transport system, ATPase component
MNGAEMAGDNAVMKVENVTKIFESDAGKVTALRGVSLSIQKGEFVSIVGPSGSGKSTLLNIIGALDRPSSGRVFIRGVDIFSLNDSELATMRNYLLGFIFQSYNLISRTTVMKNVELPTILSGMSSAERRTRALKMLEVLGIDDRPISSQAA